jgi:hypothetical protein
LALAVLAVRRKLSMIQTAMQAALEQALALGLWLLGGLARVEHRAITRAHRLAARAGLWQIRFLRNYQPLLV